MPMTLPSRAYRSARPDRRIAFGALLVATSTAICLGAPSARAAEQSMPGAAAPTLQRHDEPSAQAGSAGASAQPGAGSMSDVALEQPSSFDDPARPLRKLGLMFDLGTLEGGMMSLVYRPVPWLRVHGGAGTNGAGPGIAAGAVVAPWKDLGWSLSVGGGHFFPGDVNGLFAAFAGSDYDDSHLLEHFDYDFVTLQVGWEYESGDLMFFARGGVGLLWTQLPSDDLARIENLSSFVDPRDGSVQALLPSLSIGIIGFL